jgi:hypothetical protein
LFTGLCQAITAAIISGESLGGMLGTAGLQTVWSLPPAAVFFPIVRKMSARLDGGTARKERK